MSLTIRDAQPADRAQWQHLWQGYCRFYQVVLGEDATQATWSRILDPEAPVGCLVALDQTGVVGFANYVVHPNTWTPGDVCYLEDLFVDPSVRGKRIGKSLIDVLLARCRHEGWARLYWNTHKDNATARRLYDHYATVDSFVKYTVTIS